MRPIDQPAPSGRPVATPEEAVSELERLYASATDALRAALDDFLDGRQSPSAQTRQGFRYPELRVSYFPSGDRPSNRRAYAKFESSGVYTTTVTHPSAFRAYLLEQLRPLTAEYGATLEVGYGAQEIPYAYVTESLEKLGQTVTAEELARFFPVPLLSAVGDEIADGLRGLRVGEPRPLALFDAIRVDYSLRRLVHYTGSDWRFVQPWILFTNYHRYVDQFVQWGLEQLRAGGPYTHLHLPGNVSIDASLSPDEAAALAATSPWHRSQMPAYHLATPDNQGVTLVNIGVGPANAKTITDHLAVLRPHCWLMVGHCGGLRQSQQIGDYVLAHAYLRQDHVLDGLVPTDVPIPALAEVQVALQDAAAAITGDSGEALKGRLRTGTVVTYDDRNWELRWRQERRRIDLSRAIAVDMESGTIATQGFRLRVPYGALLCVSDKPLHGEIKLPGAASVFYERAVSQHLRIGLAALDLLRNNMETLHSRKLRSFDEPPFR
ncbi:AMP nucleosidase [Rhodoblastus sphagnicola]|uniref:AMP nucleosidase n=1 Tax=Rhodoblastus sphagnicola TaxID=333368 RepID=A0A2S6NCB6_9HYPH|nr:AMP nucleosidase [Rhodoblastus sphagnicola]MBB4200655.1 AMP nucleosidase [Rhodoblastus sphagnicola]PPQ32221.1 AMP nucleosidase [Rhodoblastus sphagnicola]